MYVTSVSTVARRRDHRYVTLRKVSSVTIEVGQDSRQGPHKFRLPTPGKQFLGFFFWIFLLHHYSCY